VKEFAFYTLARVGMFAASLAVAAGIMMLVMGTTAIPWLWPVLIAAVLSAVGSYYLLKGPRERFAAKVDERAQRAAKAFEAARAKEDRD
jgi:uncharacterized membrane protein YdfJ with MMPL/SSD domain